MRTIDADLLKREIEKDYCANGAHYSDSHEDSIEIIFCIIDSLPTSEVKGSRQLCDSKECEPPYGGKDACEFRDANGLCKACQEARMMTLDEVKAHNNQDGCIWIERKQSGVFPAFTFDDGSMVKVLSPFVSGVSQYAPEYFAWLHDQDYGEEWVAWTACPADNQRKIFP